MLVLPACAQTADARARRQPAGRAGEPVQDRGQLVPGRGSVQPGSRASSRTSSARRASTATGPPPSRRSGPSPRRRHQLSYTVAVARRRQRVRHRRHAAELPVSGARRKDPGGRRSRRAPASCSRPGASGRPRRRVVHGLQVNLPFSKRHGDVYWHWNGGFTWLPAPRRRARLDRLTDRADLSHRPSPAAPSTRCARCST